MSIIRKIRKDFAEPFRDVVAGFALMGYSQTAAADACEVARSTFQYHVQRFGLCGLFDRKNYRPECRGYNRKGRKGKRAPIYTDDHLLEILGQYGDISRERFNERQGQPCADTFCKRFGSWTGAKRLAKRKRI